MPCLLSVHAPVHAMVRMEPPQKRECRRTPLMLYLLAVHASVHAHVHGRGYEVTWTSHHHKLTKQR